jgi:RES domain-containing protein
MYPLYVADVPDNLVEEVPASSLPHDWRSVYPPNSTQRLGHDWLISQSAVGLLVPSVLISGIDPTVKNCLINPIHPEFKHATILGPVLLAVDSRFNLLA